MKRLLLSLLLAAAGASASAMNYTDAREYAYFLTDKMAYELNLTPTQYDQVYQVNLDYFLSVNSPYDLYGPYRDYRDDDLRYILYDWQYARYVGVDYFYRPLSWTGSSFIFNVYTRYSYPRSLLSSTDPPSTSPTVVQIGAIVARNTVRPTTVCA